MKIERSEIKILTLDDLKAQNANRPFTIKAGKARYSSVRKACEIGSGALITYVYMPVSPSITNIHQKIPYTLFIILLCRYVLFHRPPHRNYSTMSH